MNNGLLSYTHLMLAKHGKMTKLEGEPDGPHHILSLVNAILNQIL
jgi:hypothetical protein